MITAAALAAVVFASCKEKEDPVVILASTNSYMVYPGAKIDYDIVAWSTKSSLESISIVASDEENGRRGVGTIPVGKASYKGNFEFQVPETIAHDELRIDLYFTAADGTGNEATWHLYNFVKKETAPEEGDKEEGKQDE